MKQFLFLLFAALALSMPLPAQEDSTRITEWEDTVESVSESQSEEYRGRDIDFPFDFNFTGDFWGLAFAMTALCFAFPVIVVFLAFYFQYRNRKQRYRLAEKALEAGQPIPEEFIKRETGDKNTLNKGIGNVFTGIGLFIFLWAITHTFAIGCIGLLIMFTGIGQVIIYYVNNGRNDK